MTTIYPSRAFHVQGYATLGGVPLKINGGQVSGTVGRPSSAVIYADYSSVPEKLLTPLSPVKIWVTLESGNFSQEAVLFEGQYSGIGRSKHEQNRSIRVMAQGYSNIWFRHAFYLLNQLAPGGFTYGDAIRSRFLGSPQGYDSGQRLDDITNLFKGDLPGFIASVLDRVGSIGSEALSRTVALPDPDATSLFQTGPTIRDIFLQTIEGQTSGVAAVMTFLQSIMSQLYYEMVDMVGPAPGGRILFKPRTVFTPVPSVNVFMPENYSHFEETRSVIDAPTRMLFQTNGFLEQNPSGGTDVTTLFKAAPSALNTRLESLLKQSVRTAESLGQVLSSTVTQEEDQRGIVAEYGAISPSEWIVARENATIGAADAALADLAQYKLRLKQLEYRSAQLNHILAPRVALGFPGKIVDDEYTLVGLVTSVSHSFSVEGVSTQIGMSLTRFEDEAIDAVNPPWLSSRYASGAVYSNLLGATIEP